LLIVIALLGILAAAVIVAINPLKRMGQARDAQRKNDIGQIATALETYYTVNSFYPQCSPANCWADDINVISSALISSGDLKQMPQDPNYDPANYYYRYNFRDAMDDSCGLPVQPGQGYIIYAWLENSNDTDVAHYCGAAPGYTETDGSGKVRGLYMYYSGKKVP
ncbi:type II secretion system protein, partial [Candidatus Curtissbacteria bacterium]|nr:type II secretion system protein [Candidatus Curtissbacteria bacterium]